MAWNFYKVNAFSRFIQRAIDDSHQKLQIYSCKPIIKTNSAICRKYLTACLAQFVVTKLTIISNEYCCDNLDVQHYGTLSISSISAIIV